jgi:divalent metal cation (Fe/Co/Zn/Cd) transporter
MFLVGLEFRSDDFRSHAKGAVAISISGIVVPFVVAIFAALCGIIVALAGVGLGVLFDNPYFDGAASILIGCILATVAVLLAHETRELLVGESARPEIVAEIRALIERDPDVDSVEPPLTMQLGRDAILVNADVHLRRGLSGEDQVQVLERIVREIRTTRPQVSCISLQPK